MTYALLKSIHLLALMVWIGGMFFALFCLRPALGLIDGPVRLRFMVQVLGRFLVWVGVAVGLLLLTGVAMWWLAMQAASAQGQRFAMPWPWAAMVSLGLLMVAVYAHIRWVLFARLCAAAQVPDPAAGAAALAGVRRWVTVNLVIGVLVVLVMRVGLAA